EFGCCAKPADAAVNRPRSAKAPTTLRSFATSAIMPLPRSVSSVTGRIAEPDIVPLSGCGGLPVRRLPTPGTRTIAALCHSLVVDLRDDLAVAGEQRLGRAHLGA